jgi:hypothetical protein
MELAAAGEDLKKLREIARAHIEKAAAGDMQAIKDLADRLDGRPAQILEHSGPDSEPIRKFVHEIVHVTETPEQIAAEGEEPLLIEWRAVRDGNGSGCDDRVAEGRGSLKGCDAAAEGSAVSKTENPAACAEKISMRRY